MATNIQLSVDIAVKIAKILNDEILSKGQIQINNKKIWDGMLHKMENEVWRGVLEMFVELEHQHPNMITLQDMRNISDALALLDKFDAYYDRVLDMRNKDVGAKKTAWRALMTTREVICRCWGLDLPNKDSSKVLSNYESLFE
jgi:hypothetical protein